MNRAFSLVFNCLPSGTARRLSFRATLCAFVAGGALLACTPAYDWRTIMNNDDAYEVTLPAKPRHDEREVRIDGQPMKMKMEMAEAGDAVFAVGTVLLPSADPALQQAALQFLQKGLAKNVSAAAAASDVSIDLAAGGKVAGSEIEVKGDSGEKSESRTIHARFVARGQHVYQVAIVAGKTPPAEQIDQFFSSFKLY